MSSKQTKKNAKPTFHFHHPTQSHSEDASQESQPVLEELKACEPRAMVHETDVDPQFSLEKMYGQQCHIDSTHGPEYSKIMESRCIMTSLGRDLLFVNTLVDR